MYLPLICKLRILIVNIIKKYIFHLTEENNRKTFIYFVILRKIDYYVIMRRDVNQFRLVILYVFYAKESIPSLGN